MIFNVQHDIQSNNIHELTRPLWRLQDIFENGIDLLWRCNTLGEREQSLALNGGPNSAPILPVNHCSRMTQPYLSRLHRDVPVVDIAYGALLDMEWRKSMRLALLREQSNK
jgi:hypothetical protein